MALPKLPGQTGYLAKTYSSLDGRAIAKLTAENHISQLLHLDSPTPYDRGIVDMYTQTSLKSQDFIRMVNQTDPFFITGDSWQWTLRGLRRLPKLVGIPDSTASNANAGQDGIPFELIFDSNYFQINDVITANYQHGDKLAVVAGPEELPGGAFLYKLILVGEDVGVSTTVDRRFLQEGIEFDKIDNVVGEHDQDLSGLKGFGEYYTMVESLAAAYGVEHETTKWAAQKALSYKKDGNGNPLDLIVYDQYKMDNNGKTVYTGSVWEPMIERMMRDEMLEMRVKRMLYGTGGSLQSFGHKHEVKKIATGILHRLRNHSNYLPLNKGEFSINLLRDLFGSLFYRRVAMKDRRVRLYTNEAGTRLFNQANKDDLFNSGMTIVADNRFIQGSGQNMTVNYGFDGAWTMETGRIEVSHLMELDQIQMNSEFGNNKYSAPIFIAFDISDATGGLKGIREVRQEGVPSMTWGYINGRQHYLGHAASQGMISSSMDPGYKIWMEDRSDLFIEDLSRCVFIEQIPDFS